MATIIRPNQRPGKLSSKFGAAFAAFESNSGESNVPQAFRSAAMRKTNTKPSTLESNSASKPKETNEEKQKARFSQCNAHQGRSTNADDLSESTGKPEQSTQAPAAPNGAQQTQSSNNPTPSPVKRNFRVSSKLANRTKMFESSNNNCNKGLPTKGTTAYKNTRQGLRKVKKETSVERPTPAATESSSEPASNTETRSRNEEDELVTASTDVAEDGDDDDSESCYGYVEYLVKDTAHSTLGGVYSDDEYEETWEEETLDSTEEEEEDDWSWEEETIEDGVLVEEEEECSVGVQSS